MTHQDKKINFAEKVDRKLAWPFHPWLFTWVTVVFSCGMELGYLSGFQQSRSSMIAIIGAFAACCGIITLGRPMIRMGGYREWLRRSMQIGGASYVPTEAEQDEMRQQIKDAQAVQLVGPALAIVGTMVNGVSGLFG